MFTQGVLDCAFFGGLVGINIDFFAMYCEITPRSENPQLVVPEGGCSKDDHIGYGLGYCSGIVDMVVQFELDCQKFVEFSHQIVVW